jgi:hypothetical protein
MKSFKQLVRGLAMVIGGLAGLVFLRAPFTGSGWILMGISAILGLMCFGAYKWAEPENDESDNSN